MISAPQLLVADHDVSGFSSGVASLDEWLKTRALSNQETGASRTYAARDGSLVAGYYALAAGGVAASEAPGKIRRNMPDPIPVIILGRLAVDATWQGKGLGADLLRDAVMRSMQAAEIAGIRAMLVHALDERAAKFYERHGFAVSPIRPLTLFLRLPKAS